MVFSPLGWIRPSRHSIAPSTLSLHQISFCLLAFSSPTHCTKSWRRKREKSRWRPRVSSTGYSSYFFAAAARSASFYSSFSWRIIPLPSTISFLCFFYSRHRLGSSTEIAPFVLRTNPTLSSATSVHMNEIPFDLDICQIDIISLASCRYS